MKRISMGVFAAASLAIGTSACSQNAFDPVAVTMSPSDVVSCEKVADVSATPSKFDESDAMTQLTRAARAKGGNTLLVATDKSDRGTAYRCSMPSVAATSKASSPGSR